VNPGRSLTLLLLLGASGTTAAYDLDEHWSVTGVLAGALQCQDVSGASDADSCRGAAPVQPEFSFRPDEANEFAIKLGFAAGNALGPVSPFSVALWAADLEDDVRQVNGTGRSHLLTAWYRHTKELAPGRSLSLTAGVIDAADYLDENAYANDEYTQFMNAALVNGPSGFVPSYDAGAAIEWRAGVWSLRGVYTDVHSVESGGTHDYFGVQGSYRLRSPLGDGEYRLVLQGTSSDLPAASGAGEAARRAWIVSADQQLGETVGVWARVGNQDDAAEIEFEWLYSGGVALLGKAWGRPADDVGVGIVLARGGNLGTEELRVLEGYYRAGLTDHLAVTADLQYLWEEPAGTGGETSAWIAGLRITLAY